ncbi:MAG: HEAT repeat domain-containing protein [Candidatus Atribacteria bacterium]|nr:HEAT repeat domain-containing protein [Candidatus Atribacteria bacterium]
MDDLFVLLQKLQSGDLDAQLEAVRKLQGIPDPRVVDALIEALRDESKDPFVREDSAEALGKIGNPIAIPPLIEAFQEMDAENSDLWWKASWALLKIKDPRVTESLLEALQHDIPQVRMGAAYTLGEIGDIRAVEPLITVLREDQEERVRTQAAHALGRLGDKRAVKPLIEALKDREHSVRYAAIMALWELEAKEAIPYLIQALHDEHPSVREIAAWVLGEMGDSRVVESLLASLSDEDPSVREDIVAALGKIRANEATSPLMGMLQDENENIRVAAVWALGKIGNPQAVEPLLAILRGENLRLKKAAAWALSQIGGPKVTEVLLEALLQKDIVIIAGAYEFFVTHCPPGAEGILLEILDHFEEDEMVELLLRSENPILREGARKWARKHTPELLDTFGQNEDG